MVWLDLWHTVRVLSCSPPMQRRRWRTALRAFVSSHIHLGRHCRRSKRGQKEEFPRSCARGGGADKHKHARRLFSATCANICQPNVYMQMLRDRRRREPAAARLLVCLPVFIRLHVTECDWSDLFISFFSPLIHLALSQGLAVLEQPASSCSRVQLLRGSAQVCGWRSRAA